MSIAEIAVWATVANAFLSGGVAVSVAWMTHHFSAAREIRQAALDGEKAKKAFLREKLEKVLALVGEHVDARNTYGAEIAAMGVYVSRGQEASAISKISIAADGADAIVALYFPELHEEMRSLSAATLVHARFASDELALIRSEGAGYADGGAEAVAGRMSEAMSGLIRARASITKKGRTMIQGDLSL